MTILEPHPILLESLMGPITAHGLFFALGAVVATLTFARQVSEAQIRRFVTAIEAGVWIFVLGLLGARLGYLVIYRTEWVSFGQLFAIWEGGLVSFWGIGAGLLAAWWWGRSLKKGQRATWWKAVVLAGLLGWGIGRIGNFIMGDSVGVASTAWSVFYGRIPIQLFESAACFLLFFTLRKQAEVAWLGILGYLTARLLIDTWRDELLLGPLHISQWFALLALIVLIPLYVRRRAR